MEHDGVKEKISELEIDVSKVKKHTENLYWDEWQVIDVLEKGHEITIGKFGGQVEAISILPNVDLSELDSILEVLRNRNISDFRIYGARLPDGRVVCDNIHNNFDEEKHNFDTDTVLYFLYHNAPIWME